MTKLLQLVAFTLLLLLHARAAEVLPSAHSHNDYTRTRPLLDALDQGFASVEADIHLVEGKLLVAHDPEHVSPDRTLENMYLQPLAERVRKNSGSVYPVRADFTLLIDIKTDAEGTYQALRDILQRHSRMLTRFESNTIHTNAVTVIISGNRPTNSLPAERVRYAALDGRLPDLESNPNASLYPLVSDNWMKHFSWRGEGELNAAEKTKLHDTVKRAHQQGRRIRFWATPDTPAAWAILQAAEVDLINTDKVAALAGFLRESAGKTKSK